MHSPQGAEAGPLPSGLGAGAPGGTPGRPPAAPLLPARFMRASAAAAAAEEAGRSGAAAAGPPVQRAHRQGFSRIRYRVEVRWGGDVLVRNAAGPPVQHAKCQGKQGSVGVWPLL